MMLKSLMDMKHFIIVGIILVGAYLSIPYMIHKADDNIDWIKLHNELNNKTYVNTLDCDTINAGYFYAQQMVLTPHPDIVKDFNTIGIEKKCPSFVGDKK